MCVWACVSKCEQDSVWNKEEKEEKGAYHRKRSMTNGLPGVMASIKLDVIE